MRNRILQIKRVLSVALFVLLLSAVGMTNSYAQGNHNYVDLGLPSGILWATCNVGADTPEGYGDYFAWGETQPKEVYDWSTYQYCNGSENTLTKYCFDSNYGSNGYTDDLTYLQIEDDAASANWGAGWRIPSKNEWEELCQYTTSLWTTQNGVNGRLFTASNGNSIFLPVSGFYSGSEINEISEPGCYWSISLTTNWLTSCAWYFGFSSNSQSLSNGWYYYHREIGRPVRAVRYPENHSFNINVSPNQIEYGSVNGIGMYEMEQTCTLTAVPNEGYTFLKWKEDGAMVSTENPYSFAVRYDRNLEATFYENSTYPLTYSYNEEDHTATVTGHWEGVELTGELVIPETVMHNGETYTVTAIGDNAFMDCDGLTSVELPNSLVSIGGAAFWGCGALASIEFPNSIVSIGSEAFRDCSGLTEIVIPNSVTSIGDVNPFGGCSNLAQITVESGNAYYDSRDDSYAIIETATNKLVSGSLATVIPNTVVSIGWNAFYRILLSSITIPASVNHVGTYAIAEIYTLSSMTVLAEVPPTLGDCAFCGSDHSIPVYVPCGSLEVYQNAEGWRDYGGFDFVELCPGVVTVTANPAEYGTVTGGGSYEGGETCTVTATPNEGYFFAYWSENGRVVSAETTYSFLVIGNRDLTANFYTPQPGMINGLFSVSADQMVCFSQGNLQYQASTNTWRFAEHQWDFVGESNSNASPTYDGWIDLFAWATSGYDHSSNGYQPWSEGCNAYDGELLNLCDRTGKADWGYNAISNGGNEERLWRTCTDSEWGYLMFDRQTASGIRFAKATIGETNGVILFPDNWDATLYSLNNVNVGETPYDGNVIPLEVWMSVFEANGAVFLPASGRIQDWAENDYNQCGMYWNSSSHYVGYLKGLLSFGGDGMGLGYYYTDEQYSVRLVRAPANASYAIEAVSNPADAGTVEGSGIYDYYTAASLTAIPNEGYNFICWKENGRIVSTDNTYEVLALFDRNLEATFYETSTYPLTYSYNDEDHTAMVIGHWEGVELEGELVIPETVMHNGEAYMVTSIGEYALPDCSGLTSIVFSNSLVSIGNWAFRYCNGLTEVVIPSSVTSIGVNPFTECSNLVQITVALGNTYYDSRDDSHAIIETATNKLISGSLSTVIPSSVTSLGQDAFYIETIALMTVLAEIPPVVNVCSFCGVDKSIPVYVPCGTIEAYQNAEGWNEFTNFQEYIPELTVVSSDESMGTVAILQEPNCENDAIVQATPLGDYVFFRWTENDEIVSTEATYTFLLEEDRTLTAHFGTLINHWTPSENYQNSMFMIGVVQIDGVEQTSSMLELGAFCDGECRGTALPEEEGGQWLYFMTIGGYTGDDITFRLYDHALQQELNLYCFNTIPFEIYGLIGIDDPYEVLFASSFIVSADVNPEEAGTVAGAGEYPYSSTATLTATANEGYAFNSWTLDGEVVSTEPSYTFVVTEPVNLVANFDVVHMYQLAGTWNWWSTNLDITLDDLKAALVAATPNSTIAIKNATQNTIYSRGHWNGTLDWDVTKMYLIHVGTDCEITLEGVPLDPAEHSITIGSGINWIGFPLSESMSVIDALADFPAVNGDIIKSSTNNCVFNRGRWMGALNTFEPGVGYKFISNSSEERTIVFPTGAK